MMDNFEYLVKGCCTIYIVSIIFYLILMVVLGLCLLSFILWNNKIFSYLREIIKVVAYLLINDNILSLFLFHISQEHLNMYSSHA